MFYPVRVIDNGGKIKKVLSSKKLSKDYWKKIFEESKSRSPRKTRKKSKVLKKQDLEHSDDDYSLGE